MQETPSLANHIGTALLPSLGQISLCYILKLD